MPVYRVEVSANNRAGCKDTLCKKENVKIKKGEIRFGSFIEGVSQSGREFSGFQWRHWGCVSGKTLQNVREQLQHPDGPVGNYRWDYMDGLDEMPPHLLEKVKLAITEGKIADEDWNGDPAWNVLGKTGIRGRVKKTVPAKDDENSDTAIVEEPERPQKKKRGRAKKEEEEEEEDDDDENEHKPAKKRTTKPNRDNDDEREEKPAMKSRIKKAAKKEEDVDSMLKEENDEMHVEVKPEKKIRGKKGAKKEEDNAVKREDKDHTEVKSRKRARRKEDTKEEDIEGDLVKVEDHESDTVDIKPARKVRGRKSAKKEESEDDVGVKAEQGDYISVDIKPTRKTSGKKVVKKEEEEDGGKEFLKRESENGNDAKTSIRDETKGKAKRMKKEASDKVDFKNSPATNEGENLPNSMPADPLERISLAFCDKGGPLVAEFNLKVEEQQIASNDWEGFLQLRFQKMVDDGEVDQSDWNGFLRKLSEREMAALEQQVPNEPIIEEPATEETVPEEPNPAPKRVRKGNKKAPPSVRRASTRTARGSRA